MSRSRIQEQRMKIEQGAAWKAVENTGDVEWVGLFI